MPAPIRVLVVDDSALIRQMLIRALSLDPRIEVVGSARNGVEAVEKCVSLSPDVVTLDIQMPEMSGLEALPHIRKHSSARVVVLSSAEDPETTYRALSLGAVDFMTKPSTGVAGSLTELSEILLKKIKTAYRITPQHAATALEARSAASSGEGGQRAPLEDPGETGIAACVAIASSTGGPPALETVFSGLKANLPAAYVIVQHLPAGFSESLARRLSSVCDIPSHIAREGDTLMPGHAYIADYGRHLIVSASNGRPRLALSDDPPLHGVRPAADPLFASVAKAFGRRSVGVVLTGMGSDAAAGAVAIRHSGGDTVVQDEATSIVWGMPGATFKLGGASRLVPLGTVAAEIRRAVRSRVPEATS